MRGAFRASGVDGLRGDYRFGCRGGRIAYRSRLRALSRD